MMSPAYASLIVSRSRPKKRYARVARISLPARLLNTAMSFVNLPEQTCTNATRSRWRGSMFAWILKTKPVKRSSVGSTTPVSLGRACGCGASSTSVRRNGSRPKFVIALPKNTGVWRPARYSSRSNGVPAARITSSDSRKCAYVLSPISARASGSSRSETSTGAILPLHLALVEQEVLALEVVHAAEVLGVADRPVDRRRLDAQRALDVVEQLQRIARGAIELVDEGEDRQAMAPAHLKQLARLTLDAVRRVD